MYIYMYVYTHQIFIHIKHIYIYITSLHTHARVGCSHSMYIYIHTTFCRKITAVCICRICLHVPRSSTQSRFAECVSVVYTRRKMCTEHMVLSGVSTYLILGVGNADTCVYVCVCIINCMIYIYIYMVV